MGQQVIQEEREPLKGSGDDQPEEFRTFAFRNGCRVLSIVLDLFQMTLYQVWCIVLGVWGIVIAQRMMKDEVKNDGKCQLQTISWMLIAYGVATICACSLSITSTLGNWAVHLCSCGSEAAKMGNGSFAPADICLTTYKACFNCYACLLGLFWCTFLVPAVVFCIYLTVLVLGGCYDTFETRKTHAVNEYYPYLYPFTIMAVCTIGWCLIWCYTCEIARCFVSPFTGEWDSVKKNWAQLKVKWREFMVAVDDVRFG